MREKILITGATGTIGKELVRQLLSGGSCVRIGVRDIQNATQLDTSGCPVVIFDYNMPETFHSAFEGIDGLFLVAPMNCPRLDELLMPAIDSARELGVSHIVGLGAIGSELNETPLSVVEKCLQHSGLDFTILRPNLLMQNFLTFAGSQIRESQTIRLPAEDCRVSFIDARDVAAAAAISLENRIHRNKIYVLTGKEALDHYQIAHILSKVIGKTITYIPTSHNDSKKELMHSGWAEEAAELLIGLYEIARQGWCEEVRPDLHQILNREPINFEQFAFDYKELWL